MPKFLFEKGNKFYLLSKGNKGKHHSKRTKEILSEKFKKIAKEKGFGKWMKGKKLSEITKEKMKNSQRKRYLRNPNLIENMRKKMKGRKILWKDKISKSHMGKNNPMYGRLKEKHPNWKGGISFEPYGLEFNEDLKEVIRNRDRRKCFLCEKTELDNKRKLMVHHIDYNKQNNNPNNLITLCHSCHSKTNYNRNYWINYFYETSEEDIGVELEI